MATYRKLWTARLTAKDATSDERASLDPLMIVESDELGQSDTPLVRVQIIRGLPPSVTQLHNLEYRGPRTHATPGNEVELTGFDRQVWSSLSIARGVLTWRLRFDDGTPDYELQMSLYRPNASAFPTRISYESEGRWSTTG